MNFSGTPVSEIIITSRRQQQALQFEQDTSLEEGVWVGISMDGYSLSNCTLYRKFDTRSFIFQMHYLVRPKPSQAINYAVFLSFLRRSGSLNQKAHLRLSSSIATNISLHKSMMGTKKISKIPHEPFSLKKKEGRKRRPIPSWRSCLVKTSLERPLSL